MTDDEIRIAIAESVGWQWWEFPDGKGVKFYQIVGPGETNWQSRHKGIKCERPLATWRSHAADVPAYTEDLNAMHEVENGLQFPEAYASTLGPILLRDRSASNFDGTTAWHFAFATATARQRAEAYLRTIGKWQE